MPHQDSPVLPQSLVDADDIIVSIRNLTVGFQNKNVLENLSLDIRSGQILGIAGGSGSGKSVLMRTILGLCDKKSGQIKIFGLDLDRGSDSEHLAIDMRKGVLFQQGALFSSLTVVENVQVPMREYLDLTPSLMEELAMLKIHMVGLPADAAKKIPSELSGGMIKRAALARALALDPDLLFLDEPTAGLDPVSAADLDELIIKLRDAFGLTVYMITHDLDSLFFACDRVAVLGEKHVLLHGTIQDMLESNQPWIKSYFRGKRSRRMVHASGQDQL